MLEVRKNIYSRNYENKFFKELAKYLYKSFESTGRSGLLIGSPICKVDERLQIDALLITNKVICIIDFKNYDGIINLPDEDNFEQGQWTNALGEQVKGGSSINPFIQLKIQKKRFSQIYDRNIKPNLFVGDFFNPNHLVRIVCFHEQINLKGKIPNKEALNFFILDKLNFLEGILDIIDVSDQDIDISLNSYAAFQSVFLADNFKLEEKPFEDIEDEFDYASTQTNKNSLKEDQKHALKEIKAFIETPGQNIFVLQGTTNSGKSYLIPFIQELAYKQGILETEIFASSHRIANNLVGNKAIQKVNSIYSYIYGGHPNEKKDQTEGIYDETLLIGEEPISEEIVTEEIPIKSSDNSENALFIVDEAQLITDSFNQSIDLIFGSGYLLKDFLIFADILKTKRKIIFVGDKFQLHGGNTDESPLNTKYLESQYALKTNAFELLDKPEFSCINKEALRCVDKIKEKHFNSLKFKKNKSFVFLQHEDILEKITNTIINKINSCILCYSNEESQRINFWIKKSILKNGDDIEVNDCIVFNNNISINNINDPFSKPKKVYNGQFATVTKVSDKLIERSVKTKRQTESTVLTFREISLLLADSQQEINVLSLENYRTDEKGELSREEVIGIKILLNLLIIEHQNITPFEVSEAYSSVLYSDEYLRFESEIIELNKVLSKQERDNIKINDKRKRQVEILKKAKKIHLQDIKDKFCKDPTSVYNKYKNAAYLRFSWAMTVHKSRSYKWDEIIFNIAKPGTTNENHFRWLYTGLTRATNKISLINYKPISPFDKANFIDHNQNQSKRFFFISETMNVQIAKEDLIQFVEQKLNHEFKIKRIETQGWILRLNIFVNNDEATFDFGFNAKYQFKSPIYLSGNKEFATLVLRALRVTNQQYTFDNFPDSWRKDEYISFSTALVQDGFILSQLIQTGYKDKMKIIKNFGEIDLEFDYTGDGYFSRITATYFSEVSYWESIQDMLKQL